MRRFLDPKLVVLIAATISKKNGGTQCMKGVSEEDVEIIIDKARLFSFYLQGKDVFKKYYKQHLVELFLSGKVVYDLLQHLFDVCLVVVALKSYVQEELVYNFSNEELTSFEDIENDNKQNHPIKKSKRTTQAYEEKATGDTYLDAGVLNVQHHLAIRSETPKNDFLSTNEWTGRKDRRHKGKKKTLEGKNQVLSSENIQDSNVQEQIRYVDEGPGEGGTKTVRQVQAEEDDPWGQESIAVGHYPKDGGVLCGTLRTVRHKSRQNRTDHRSWTLGECTRPIG
ncbi:hypothetical protein V6N13_037584 [Hibiscus sabdariffa]